MAYFPNGTSGEVLDAQCAECPLGELPCPVALVQIHWNYDQCGNKMAREIINALVDEKGECQMFKQIKAAKLAATEPPEKQFHAIDIMPGMREWARKKGLI